MLFVKGQKDGFGSTLPDKTVGQTNHAQVIEFQNCWRIDRRAGFSVQLLWRGCHQARVLQPLHSCFNRWNNMPRRLLRYRLPLRTELIVEIHSAPSRQLPHLEVGVESIRKVTSTTESPGSRDVVIAVLIDAKGALESTWSPLDPGRTPS